MRVWITCFIMLFGGAELLQWFQQISLPMPVLVMGGALLAIMSNYRKLFPVAMPLPGEEPKLSEKQSPPMPPTQPIAKVPVGQRADRPISFEIRRPFHPGD